jgi:DNA mismatch repair protein MutL
MPIRVLPSKVSALIAAGEVIERPASVVRELLENALDAGATTIEVDIAGRHFTRIIVSDNGPGLTPEDLALACARHATSKLPGDNVNAIATLGFRGEALPSIAAVAQVRITSRPKEQDVAFTVSAKADQISKVMPCAGGFSTRVEVEGLFENHPARQAFQKSFNTELAAVQDVFDRIALAWPSVKFVLRSASRTVTYPARADLAGRIRDVRGEPLSSNAVTVEFIHNEIEVIGLTSLPTVMDETKKGNLDLIVNGRLISDRSLSTVVQSVYKGLTGTTDRPFASLSISIDPAEVNVNVHPTKSEVRFRDPGKVAEVVRLAVGNALHQMGIRSRKGISDLARVLAAPAVDSTDSRRRPLGRFLTQANDSWIIAETLDGLVLIDQHAAHERLVLERLKKAAADLPDEIVRLEKPFTHSVSNAQAAAVSDLSESLNDFGFGVVAVDRVVSISSFPSVLSDCPMSELAELIVDHCEMGTVSGLLGDALWEKLATAACKAAIKAGHRLTPERADALLREIEATPNASYCNHGRPTVRYLTNSEIGSMFER